MRKKLHLEDLNRMDLHSFKNASKYPLIVIADNIRSGMNVGSIFRTCDAFAVQEMVLCGITPRPPHKEINKTAIGASESVQWSYYSEGTEIIKKLKDQGYCIIAVEQTDDSIDLQSFKIEIGRSYALIFGNEINGVDDDLLPLVDYCIEVPQFGTKHSFNVSVCAGIVLWEFVKCRI